MILTIRTDKPEAEIGLYENGEQVAYEKWQAHRELAETIHQKVNALLSAQSASLKSVAGIIVFRGPGSFTGLRIGISVANALAYSLNVPVAGTKGDDWIQNGLEKLARGKESSTVLPEYGAPVYTTKPKK